MATRHVLWVLGVILGTATLVFGVVSVILVHKGGMPATDGYGLAIGGTLFGFTVATAIVKPPQLVHLPPWSVRVIGAFAWAVAILGFCVFIGVWVRYFYLARHLTGKAEWRTAWRYGGVSLALVMAIAPSALAIDDWRSRLAAAQRDRLPAEEGVDTGPPVKERVGAYPHNVDNQECGGRYEAVDSAVSVPPPHQPTPLDPLT